jgi:hypothetical protein
MESFIHFMELGLDSLQGLILIFNH